jgi:hypothetical protein
LDRRVARKVARLHRVARATRQHVSRLFHPKRHGTDEKMWKFRFVALVLPRKKRDKFTAHFLNVVFPLEDTPIVVFF